MTSAAYGVGQIVVDNFDELETLNQLPSPRRAGHPVQIKPASCAYA
ncbi:MAG: hypothetical protein ACLSDO_02030 [Anaerotruncus colihominis]